MTPLNNGDIVQIITNDNSKGPSRDWLKFIKSTNAKTKILQWFKKKDREENIIKGKSVIEKEIKKIGMSYDKLFIEKYYTPALQRYGFKNLDEMYSAVGFGSIGANKIISRILEEYRKDNAEKIDLEKKMEELHSFSKSPKASKTGIIVKGIDNCLVKISKCCNPVKGDEIIGYTEDPNSTSYNVNIYVYANDRKDLLADIIKLISSSDIKLIGVTAKSTPEKIALIVLSIEVKNTRQLNTIEREIGKVDSVYDVKRKK